ncbi:hypothetical protein QYE76_004693 [Lolium multiflorum]|uniref:CCHC-type domain-containing protein n=1 Tax=Lolium multiflorum TaxID=4521 RepID=A0AAD8W2G9_LOLMU|nr:hypothetical protein QYE76_004693 [Lolium multiflorum]
MGRAHLHGPAQERCAGFQRPLTSNARSNLLNKDRPRRQGSSSGDGGGQQQHQQPQWWLDREKKREARRAAAAAQQPENSEADRGRGRGSARAAGKPPAPPARKQQGVAGPPVPAGGGAGGSGLAQVECFKCGRPGHFQASCTAEPICVICGKEGHHSAACPSKGKEPELSMMGHAISGEGFFYVDFEEDDDEEDDLSNSAIITFPGVALTAAGLEQELRHLVEGDWDWQVRALGEREFAVVFPSRATLTFSARSGKLYLTLCGTVVDIKLADADPAPAEKLQEVWVRISGLPRCMRRTRRLMVGMRMLGRPLEVDHSTLKARGPVRMRVACRNPSKLNGAVQFFHNSLGYNVGIRVEEPRGATSAPRPPSPPHQDDDMDDDDDDANSPSEDEWRALGEKDRAQAAERSKSLPVTTQSREPAAEATGEPAEPVAVITARGASEPPALRGQTRAAEGARREQALTHPPAAVKTDPPVSPPVDSSTLLTTGSDYDSEDSLGSPAMHKDTGRVVEAEEEGGVVDDTDDFARRPVLREATVPRARRTRTVPVGPARKSARLQGPASAIPILQRAQEFTAAKNLDPTGLAFSVESGTATDVISFIRAKEEAQAALAFAAARRAHSEAGEASLLGEAPAESIETAQAEAVVEQDQVGHPSWTEVPRSAMRAGFWNIRGYHAPGRQPQIRELLAREHLDIVGLQETIKREFSQADLRSIDPQGKFAWHSLPALGHSGGILVGVNEDTFEAIAWTEGRFFLRVDILQLATNTMWTVFVVYGPADHRFSDEFLGELSTAVNAAPFRWRLAEILT